MTTISDGRLAFMRELGITEDDVMDPLLVNGGNGDKYHIVESRFCDNPDRENMPDDSFLKTSRAVFFGAESPEPQNFLLNKERPFQGKANGGTCTGGLSPERLKANGNKAFEEGRYREALNCYTDAIEILLDSGNYKFKEHGSLNAKGNGVVNSGFSVGDSRIILLAALFSNRSACYLQASKQIGTAEAFESAMRDADRAVELRPTWFKGYSRQGDAFFKMKKYSQAAEAYEMALQFDPGNDNLLQSVQEVRRRCVTEARERVDMRKKQTVLAHTERGAASVSFAPVTVSAPANVSTNGGVTGRRESGQMKPTARQLWNEFKPKLEASVQQPTGDDYRREQLRLFREQKERDKNITSSPFNASRGKSSESVSKENDKEQIVSGNVEPTTRVSSRKDRLDFIPKEFSSDAAAAYQQRLLEEYRRRKAQRL